MNNLQYGEVRSEIISLLQSARNVSARSVNALMTATYWEIGRRIVEFEQGGQERAEYGEALIRQLADDLEPRFGRGFGWRNLTQMRAFWQKRNLIKSWRKHFGNDGLFHDAVGSSPCSKKPSTKESFVTASIWS